MEPSVNDRRRQIIATLAVLIVVVAIVAAVTATNHKDAMKNTADTTSTVSMPATTDTTPATTVTPSPTTSANTASTYKDGTYTATSSYDSPGGAQDLTVSVTLQSDVVTATSAISGANDPEAHEYQSDFISGYKSLVVGKDIGSIHLSRVSGSSLTSQGFNSAIAKIEAKAKA